MKAVLLKFKLNTKTFLQRVYITLQLYVENGLANHAAACAYGFLLSMAPMLLIIALIIFFTFRASPGSIIALMSTIPFLGSMFDEQWLSSGFFSFSRPGIPGVISVLSIIWAGRILALSMQRGLKIIFPPVKKRNPVKNVLVSLTIEASVLILVLMVIVSSRTAVRFYAMLDFFQSPSITQFIASRNRIQIFYIILLGLASFFVYLFVPEDSPNKFSAFCGALFCTLFYFCMVLILGVILNRARYNFLYGTFGNLIIILVNVYLFFTFFFTGAQLAFVIDSFDALLFSSLRKIKKKISGGDKSIRLSKKFWFSRYLYKLFNPRESNLKKYLRSFKENESIFTHGNDMDTEDDIYYLLEGEVEILISSLHGSGDFAGVLRADSFFDKMSYMLSEDRTATVRAKTDVSVFAMPPQMLDAVLKYDKNMDRTLIELMSRRLKHSDEKTI
ncbi:MAG: YihY/virulence factor BrkB family protein [Treponema sp.]|jgi:membrane protein|nr:YihY/virulence factor BrkB family protein [Treponema sp.]